MCSPTSCTELLLPCVHSGLEAMPEKNVRSAQLFPADLHVACQSWRGDGRWEEEGSGLPIRITSPRAGFIPTCLWPENPIDQKGRARASRLGCMGSYHLKICVGPPSPQLQFSWWGIYASVVWENAKTDKAHSMTFGIILPWTRIPATH